MNRAQRYELEHIALALAAYRKAADERPELRRILNHIPVPGGQDIEYFAMMAVKLSNQLPYER